MTTTGRPPPQEGVDFVTINGVRWWRSPIDEDWVAAQLVRNAPVRNVDGRTAGLKPRALYPDMRPVPAEPKR